VLKRCSPPANPALGRRAPGPAAHLAAISVAILLVVATGPRATTGQEAPLPDLQAFLKEASKRLEPDEVRQSGYMYVETRRQLKLDGSGRATREAVKVYESYPGLPGEGRWERLIAEDGKPVPPAELAKLDRERHRKVMEYVRKRERDPEKVAAAEARQRAEDRRELEAAVDDVLRVFEIRMLGREVVGGHGTVLLSFTPRRNGKPRTNTGRIISHFAGKAWVSETEYELVRMEAEALDDLSFGLGLLARVHKGSKATFERRKVNGEVWLPASANYTASARVMLVRRLRVGGTSEFSDYRKFTVATETSGVRVQ
jgi:hypothetical protein